MGDKPKESSDDAFAQSLDLSALSSLNFGPSWSTGEVKDKPADDELERLERSEREGRARGPANRDRRTKFPPRSGGDRGAPPRDRRERQDPHFQDNRDRRGGPREQRRPFQPVLDITIYPEDEPFKALAQAIRNSMRTFELFEIVRLILEKPERYVVVAKPKAERDQEAKEFFLSVPDGLPFETEDEAINHVLMHYFDRWFDVQEIEGEPPKGSFTQVNKCGITGELLGPPNYHRYQKLLQLHHSERLPNMSFERFAQRIESVREQEQIDAWLEQMKKQTRFLFKVTEGEEPPAFDDAESARFYLLTHRKEQVVRKAASARFSGKAIALLPEGSLYRQSLEWLVEGQRRFPLDTANHLRGRLRRMNFAVYKKGSKGVSYVSAVKRRFRDPGQVFAESVEHLLEFVEKHPNFPVSRLPEEYLGIVPPNADGTPKEGQSELDDDEKKALAQLARDLRWLVSEGYMTEYSNGALFAPPPREAPAKEPKPADGKPKSDAKASEPGTSDEEGADAATSLAAMGNSLSEAEADLEPPEPAPSTSEPAEAPPTEKSDWSTGPQAGGVPADPAAAESPEAPQAAQDEAAPKPEAPTEADPEENEPTAAETPAAQVLAEAPAAEEPREAAPVEEPTERPDPDHVKQQQAPEAREEPQDAGTEERSEAASKG